MLRIKRLWFLQKNCADLSSISAEQSGPVFLAHPVDYNLADISIFCFRVQTADELLEETHQRSADVRWGHAADASAHRSRAYSDVANLGRKELTGVDVDAGECDADEQFAEHRKRDSRHAVVCTRRHTRQRKM